MGYLYILGTIILTVIGQLVLKWRIGKYGSLPDLWGDKISFLFRLLLDPFILGGFFAAFIAGLCWMAAMSKFELSHAYPFMGLTFVLVLFFSGLLFHEPVTWPKILGIVLIVAGIAMASQG
jgi:multidrug transporter EmrE-like cation transporter